jgi:hypothetical protein
MDRPPRPVVDLTARCACGSVTLRLSGKVRAMLLCACEDCQRATGTGHSSVALANAADVTVSGETRSFATTANSGAIFTRSFCPNCGTPICGRSSRAPQLIMLPVGLFGVGASWFAPTQMIFARSHRDWDLVAEGMPRYDTYRDPASVA